MLTQNEADSLIEMLKHLREQKSSFDFPMPGQMRRIDLISEDGRHEFIVDINRKGSVNLARKCTYQGRYMKDVALLRLDIGGPGHTNPDGKVLRGDHFHIYKEGYGDRFAVELPAEIVNPDDLIQTLIDFLLYFRTVDADSLDIQTVI